MKAQRILAAIPLFLSAVLVPIAAHALDVTLSVVGVDANGFPFEHPVTPQPVSGTAAVNLDADSPVGAPVIYTDPLTNTTFTIARCGGCAGRARVFIVDGTIDKLVMTDAQITNTSANVATLRIRASSGPLSVSGPSGTYPYATELSGSFVAPFGQLATDPANRIQVTATTNTGSCDGDCMIDNPQLDAGETDANGITNPFKYSVVAPPFLTSGAASFAPKEAQNLACGNVFNDSGTFCQPSLSLSIDISLKSRHAARIPGSVGAFHVGARCEPGSTDPALTAGCDLIADLFASLGPKGFNLYDVRMEPSPGSQDVIVFRLGAPNSSEQWVTKRGDMDANGNGGGNVSNTGAKLSSNGTGSVKANGLCPVSGCPTANALPVRVYCAGAVVFESSLILNGKGDGRTDVVFSLPCPDPAVLIMDPSDTNWVAAPAIL